MAQTKVLRPAGNDGLGGMDKLRFAHLEITNNGGETTINVTPADCGMAGFVAWFCVNRNGNVVSILQTYVGNLASNLALTFTANNNLDLFVLGV